MSISLIRQITEIIQITVQIYYENYEIRAHFHPPSNLHPPTHFRQIPYEFSGRSAFMSISLIMQITEITQITVQISTAPTVRDRQLTTIP